VEKEKNNDKYGGSNTITSAATFANATFHTRVAVFGALR
jgi:hypothetical protein